MNFCSWLYGTGQTLQTGSTGNTDNIQGYSGADGAKGQTGYTGGARIQGPTRNSESTGQRRAKGYVGANGAADR